MLLVKQERECALDATIVKILKTRKVISFSELVELIMNLNDNFKPEMALIKSRIEMLIEREYLARDSN